jgi:hypothetical protein
MMLDLALSALVVAAGEHDLRDARALALVRKGIVRHVAAPRNMHEQLWAGLTDLGLEYYVPRLRTASSLSTPSRCSSLHSTLSVANHYNHFNNVLSLSAFPVRSGSKL